MYGGFLFLYASVVEAVSDVEEDESGIISDIILSISVTLCVSKLLKSRLVILVDENIADIVVTLRVSKFDKSKLKVVSLYPASPNI